ncbi:MAG TPA: EscU/YscU/HrcU family type III secretion system export apparatus switch protein [Polyangia bacterium]|jgi:flagellar biosynthesis protein FlhB
MAGERTEEPTPKRLEDARRRGEVAVSRDATSAAAMTAAIVALVLQGPALTARLLGYWKAAFAGAAAAAPGGSATAALAAGLGVMARALAVPLAAAALVALGAGLLQTRGLLAFGALRPDLARLSPAAGLGRAFGGQAAVQVGKGLLKAVLVAALAWLTVRPVLGGLAGLAGAPIPRLAGALGVIAAQLAERVALVALALGLADYLLVRRRHLARQRMTREEVRREHKESEGDPSHRAERQRLHRELLEQRMVAEVRKADFVVVNPDHIAVALRYDRDGEAAPVVVARGERLLAERIKQVAREAGVPIFRDVTLARSLRDLPEGTEIPAALYEAVAEILRVVYAMPPSPAAASAPAPATGAPIQAGAGWRRA